jgi:hypothetical protein
MNCLLIREPFGRRRIDCRIENKRCQVPFFKINFYFYEKFRF